MSFGRAKLLLLVALCLPLIGSSLEHSMDRIRTTPFYGASGPMGNGKCWVGSLVSGSGGSFTVSIATAGFTAVPFVHLQSLTVVAPIQRNPQQQSVGLFDATRTSISGMAFNGNQGTAGITVYVQACGI